MSMYGFDASFYDYGFSDPAITSSIYGSPRIEFDDNDDIYYRRRQHTTTPSVNIRTKTPNTSPPEHRHDGTSPLPLGMDWSLPPPVWEGRNSVWPHESQKKWSYCVTVPSWTVIPSASGADTVFYKVQVGIQSPEGITSTQEVLRRFNEFLQLHSELKKEFPKKKLPPTPPKRLTKMRSKTVLEERRCALEVWIEKLLSDVKVSRTAVVAIFLELEAAARKSYSEMDPHDTTANAVPSDQFPSSATSLVESSSSIASDLDNTCANETSENQNYAEPNTQIETSSKTQRDLEELTRKCMELELRLTIEQDARAYAESITATLIQHNTMLKNDLDYARLVESLKTSPSDSKQQFDKLMKDTAELENAEMQDGREETMIKESDEEDATMTNAILM